MKSEEFPLAVHLQFSKTLPIRPKAGWLLGDLDGSSYEIRTKGGQENSIPGMQNVWGVETEEADPAKKQELIPRVQIVPWPSSLR